MTSENLLELIEKVVKSRAEYQYVELKAAKKGCPEKLYCIARRNDWMIEHSKYVICYVKHITGGAAQFMKKAQRKNRIVINLA